MTLPTRPSYDQVSALPRLLHGEVEPSFIDVNGHMNIRHYLEYGAVSADVVCRDVGIDDAYRANRGMGVFTAEHHLRYFSEMRLGASFSVYTQVLAHSARSAHFLAYLLDDAGRSLACTVEIVLVHVDMSTRRAVPFPAEVADGLDEWRRRTTQVEWPPAICGAMGIRD